MSRLGDIREHDPEEQLYLRRLFDWSDFGAIFDSIPLVGLVSKRFISLIFPNMGYGSLYMRGVIYKTGTI